MSEMKQCGCDAFIGRSSIPPAHLLSINSESIISPNFPLSAIELTLNHALPRAMIRTQGNGNQPFGFPRDRAHPAVPLLPLRICHGSRNSTPGQKTFALSDQRGRSRTWNSLGHFVRHGESGILILAPMVCRKAKTEEGFVVSIFTGRSFYATGPLILSDLWTYKVDISQSLRCLAADPRWVARTITFMRLVGNCKFSYFATQR